MKTTRIKLVFLMLLLAGGCRDVFEKDISEKDVVLVAPADSVETIHRTLTFAWKEKEGATGYRLVIVSPSFERAELYLLDTLVDGLRYTVMLEPGEYAWGVRPENSAYEGIYNRRVLTVLDDEDNETPDEP